MKKNVASQIVGCELIAKADGTPVTTGTTTIYITGDNGTQGAGSVSSGACTHKGNGAWTYALTQAETNFDHVLYTFVNTAAVNVTVQVYPLDVAYIADGVLDRNMATGTDSGSPTVRTVRQALRFLRNKWTLSAGTLTVMKEDDGTTSWTSAVTTDVAAEPIVSSDPASS